MGLFDKGNTARASGPSQLAATPKPRPETLSHAVVRMRSQGFNDNAIRGQVKRWHPNWPNAKIAGSLGAPPKHGFVAVDKQGRQIPAPPADWGLGAAKGVLHGAEHLGRAELSAIPLLAGHPLRRGNPDPMLAIAKRQALSTYRPLRHPLRNPESTVLDVAGLLPLGKLAKLGETLKGAKPLEEIATKAPVSDAEALSGHAEVKAKVSGKLTHAKSVRTRQESGYTPQRVAKIAAAETAMHSAPGMAGFDAALAAHRGELDKIHFAGFGDLTPENLDHAAEIIKDHSGLTHYQKLNVANALRDAVNKGEVPTHGELKLIEHVFGKQTTLSLQKHSQSWGNVALNVLNIPRSLQSTADVSGMARQALVAGTTHPILWAKTWPDTLKSFGSGTHFANLQEDIGQHTLFPLAQAAGIRFTDVGEHASVASHEEAFASEYATKIPIFGHIVKGSSRAYTGGLNKLRMNLFEHQIRYAQSAGLNIHNEDYLKSIGDVINAATGRGTLPDFADHLLPAMNTIFYSPRLMLSRINYLDPTWYVRLGRGLPKAEARHVRIEALKGLLATAGYVTSTLYMLSRIPGVHVGSLDPRSADFGKIKVGDTRFDIAGGFQQYVRIAAEIATNTKVSSTTGTKIKLGSGYGKPTAWDELVNFFVNKASPPVSATINAVRRKDAVGNPVLYPGQGKKTLGVRFGTMVPNYFVPLVIQDARGLYKERHGGMNGIAAALAGYGISAIGVGVQTYGPKATNTDPLSGSYSGSLFSHHSGGDSSGLFSGSSSGSGGGLFGH